MSWSWKKSISVIAVVVLFAAGGFLFVHSLKAAGGLTGRILLQVQSHGEAWYVNPADGQRIYLKDGELAYSLMRQLGLGITNANLDKIPVGLEQRFQDIDSDNDGLPDRLEEGLKTNPQNADTDGDGYPDGEEVTNGYNPLGANKMLVDKNLVESTKGKILLQVQNHGEAWYLNPADGRRYYLRDGNAAYEIMRFLSLGITNEDLNTIPISKIILDNSTGCRYNNPACNANYSCVNNACVLKSGCQYNNPACGSGYTCINNTCQISQPNVGCQYNNPVCSLNQTCVNNTCVFKTGCQYNNPVCTVGYDCINNTCQVHKAEAGCEHSNPNCDAEHTCINNVCVLNTGCKYNRPACGANYNCINDVCILKTGCNYNNLPCNEHSTCLNNACVLKSGCDHSNPACNSNQTCINNACILKSGCQYTNPACATGYDCINNTCVIKTTNLNLEVVFFNVDSCYVAEKCNKGDVCDYIKDYRPETISNNIVLFYFKPGTLKILGPAQAEAEGYGTDSNKLKYCVHTFFNDSQLAAIQSNYTDVSNFIYSWTNQGLRIIPHFRVGDAEFSSDGGLLQKDQNSATGFVTGQGPPYSEIGYYAERAGVDLNNMDMFASLVNNYPVTGSANDGLLAQQYIGGTGGWFNGVAVVTQMGVESRTNWNNNRMEFPALNRELFIAITIHELNHVINMGQYSVSGLTDVYGIQSAPEGIGYNSVTNPHPHCLFTNHYTNGKPDPYKYFPDSYYWLDPMFNTKPLEPYPQSGALSFCDQPDDGSLTWPTVNPLDPNDHYADIQGFPETMKYYKFIYQAHWSPDFAGKFYTNSYRKGLQIYSF